MIAAAVGSWWAPRGRRPGPARGGSERWGDERNPLIVTRGDAGDFLGTFVNSRNSSRFEVPPHVGFARRRWRGSRRSGLRCSRRRQNGRVAGSPRARRGASNVAGPARRASGLATTRRGRTSARSRGPRAPRTRVPLAHLWSHCHPPRMVRCRYTILNASSLDAGGIPGGGPLAYPEAFGTSGSVAQATTGERSGAVLAARPDELRTFGLDHTAMPRLACDEAPLAVIEDAVGAILKHKNNGWSIPVTLRPWRQRACISSSRLRLSGRSGNTRRQRVSSVRSKTSTSLEPFSIRCGGSAFASWCLGAGSSAWSATSGRLGDGTKGGTPSCDFMRPPSFTTARWDTSTWCPTSGRKPGTLTAMLAAAASSASPTNFEVLGCENRESRGLPAAAAPATGMLLQTSVVGSRASGLGRQTDSPQTGDGRPRLRDCCVGPVLRRMAVAGSWSPDRALRRLYDRAVAALDDLGRRRARHPAGDGAARATLRPGAGIPTAIDTP